MKRILSGLALAGLITTQAAAAEPISTAKDATTASPTAPAPAAPPLGAAPIQLGPDDQPIAPAEAGCNGLASPDGKPHGVVWAGVGTHGYRDMGTAVTAPLGKCGSVSIAIDRTEGAFGGWRR